MLGGVAEMMGRWRQIEGYDPADSAFLVLSGGDNWTGPAISSFFDGQSAFEVMQAMGYDASAVGNHEFDFGIDLLRGRMASSTFPYVAANIVRKGTTETADGFSPFAVLDANGVRIAFIGLTTVSTPFTTNPVNVADYDFLPYVDALRTWVPEAQAAGADMIVGLGHICEGELVTLAPTAGDLGVDLLTGGHCNESVSREVAGVQILIGGKYWQSYARLDLTFDVEKDEIVEAEGTLVDNAYKGQPAAEPDAAIATIVEKWSAKAALTLDEVIGYSEGGIKRPWPLFNLITDAWLAEYPNADIAYTNAGGVRQDIEAGEITIGDIYSVLPFNNVLIDVEVTGRDILRNLICCAGVFSGMRWHKDGSVTLVDGSPLDVDATYHVLINDFMFAGGDNYLFGEQDPDGYNTGIDWRQPVIDYIQALDTSPSRPIDGLLDVKYRGGGR